MKRFIGLIAALAVLVVPTTASASTVNRQIATHCVSGIIIAVKVIDNTTRNTGVPCTGWAPDPTRPNFTYGRPVTDVEGATRSAKAWWGHCVREQYAAFWGVDHPTYYYTNWHITC